MPDSSIRIGLIGCGLNMREAHARRLLQMPEARIAGICDPERENVERMRDAHALLRGLPAFADYRELLDQTPLDAVVVSTPHVFHYPQISEALQRGLHVLAEKPLVTRSEHARRLIELRDKRRRVLLLSYQRHYQGAYRHLRRLVQAGTLGRINMIVGHQSEDWLTANAGRWRTEPEISGGGVVADVMSHILEALLWITDHRPEEVYACFDGRGTRVEVVAALTVRFENGLTASISTGGDTRRPCFHEEINLWGERGAVELVWERGAVITEWLPQRRNVPESEWPAGSDPDRNFVNAVLGLEPVECPAEWGLKVTLLKEAAWESGRLRQPVRVARA